MLQFPNHIPKPPSPGAEIDGTAYDPMPTGLTEAEVRALVEEARQNEMPPEERKAMAFAAQVQAGKIEFDGDFPHPAAVQRFDRDYAKEQAAMSESTRDSLRPRQPDQRESAEAHREAAAFWRQTADAAQTEAATDRLRAREEEGQAARARAR